VGGDEVILAVLCAGDDGRVEFGGEGLHTMDCIDVVSPFELGEGAPFFSHSGVGWCARCISRSFHNC
jgi:hypothetical protein